MVGTGVFTTSGFALKDLGSPWAVLLAWVVGGVLAAMGALCYGALGRRLPESGGEYLFLARTLHPAAGFIAGWLSLLVGFSAPMAAAAFGFGAYAQPWLGDVSPRVPGTILMVLFGVLHAFPVRRGAAVQNAVVLLKVLLIVGLVVYAIGRLPDLPPLTWAPATGSAFAITLVWVSFSYSGWNAAVYVAGEIVDPDRNLPRSLLLATGFVTVLYVALNAIFVFSAPLERLAGQLDVARIAAEALGGSKLASLVSAVILLALATSVSSLAMAGPRVCSRMAADGWLPRSLAAGDGPPRWAIGLQILVATAMLWTSAYEALLTYIGFTLSLSTAATVFGLMRLRQREGPGLPVPGWPWLPASFIGAVLAIAAFTIFQRPIESMLGAATIGLGWLAWAVQRRSSTSLGSAPADPSSR